MDDFTTYYVNVIEPEPQPPKGGCLWLIVVTLLCAGLYILL